MIQHELVHHNTVLVYFDTTCTNIPLFNTSIVWYYVLVQPNTALVYCDKGQVYGNTTCITIYLYTRVVYTSRLHYSCNNTLSVIIWFMVEPGPLDWQGCKGRLNRTHCQKYLMTYSPHMWWTRQCHFRHSMWRKCCFRICNWGIDLYIVAAVGLWSHFKVSVILDQIHRSV